MSTRPTLPNGSLVGVPSLMACVALVAGTTVPLPLSAQDTGERNAQEWVDFRVFDGHGGASSLEAVLDAAAESEVLLIGEEHDDVVGHSLELQLLSGVAGRLFETGREPRRPVVLSLEMFERDVQYVLDEYLAGLISEDHFVASGRAWDDYAAAYRPLVEFARAHGIRVVAANAPRRYVNRVTASGPVALLDLSPLAQSYLPPLPFPGPSERYRAQWDLAMTQGADTTAGTHVHATSPHAIQAQALWDASMGHAITGALVQSLGALVVHVAGAFHVAHGTGIPERISDYRPGTRVTTVVITKADDADAWDEAEHSGLADFVVLTATRSRS